MIRLALLSLAVLTVTGLGTGCRKPDPGACPPATDCTSCTQMECNYCLEDGHCIVVGGACVGDVARTPGECEGASFAPVDAEATDSEVSPEAPDAAVVER